MLMARQQKLLGTLAAQPESEPIRRHKIQLSAEEREQLLARERDALDEAMSCLARNDPDAARQLLEPFAASAQDTRTLTTLSRIASLRGQMEEALSLMQQAEALDASDPKVLHFMAELMRQLGRHLDELQYRRRAAFSSADAPALAFARLIPAIVRASPKRRRPLAEIRLALDRVMAADDLPPSSLMAVAESIYGLPGMREQAIALYNQVVPPGDAQRDATARRQSLAQWCASHGAPMHRLDDHGVPGRRPTFARLERAVVVPALQWLPLPDEGRIVLSGIASRGLPLRSEFPESPLILTSEADVLVRLPKALPRLDGPLMLVGGTGAYDSDLVEFVGALAVAETLGQGGDLRLLVNDDLAPHQYELFELLGVASDRLQRWPPSSTVLVDTLWIPTRLIAGQAWCDPLLPRWYRARMSAHMAPGPGRRRIYLACDTHGPRIQNEEAVIAALTPLGFEHVSPEGLTVRAAIRLFSEAAHVVSTRGPALANLLFAHPGTAVTFLAADRQPTAAYENLAGACGHVHRTVRCLRPVRSAEVDTSDVAFAADCEALLACV